MSGDWIKMRSNLWDDPRIGRICDMTGCKEATAIGALYWLWATADQHTEDGCMPGLSMQQIDRKTGLKGFAAALVDVNWLRDDPQGVVIAHFEEHNGASAKKRHETARRVAKHRSGNDDETPERENGNAPSVTGALARDRVEKEKKETPPTPSSAAPSPPLTGLSEDDPPEAAGIPPTAAGAICGALRRAGVQRVNPQHPTLLALIAAGATAEELLPLAEQAKGKGEPFAYLLDVATKQRQRAAEVAPTLARGSIAPPAPVNRDAERTSAYLREQDERDQEAIGPPAAVLERLKKLRTV